MTLIDLQKISKKFTDKPLLDGVDLTIKRGEKIAIIGKNGCGKSTLIKIIEGALEPDGGKKIAAQNLSITCLSQAPVFANGESVKGVIESSLAEIKSAKDELDAINEELAAQNQTNLERHGFLTAYLDFHDGWNIDAKCERILQEFKLFSMQDAQANLLSGGEKRRLAIAAALLKGADLLLLDEPTNHLDIFMIEFLQEILARPHYTVVFISHDRYFIDALAQKTVELENGTLRHFNGGYSKYLEQKQEILERLIKAHESDMRLLKSELEWLRKGVKARLKRNEGRKKRIEELKLSVKKNPAAIRNIQSFLQKESLTLEPPQNQRKCLFELKDLSLAVGGKTLFEGFSTRILQGDKIAIVGANGCGKTSFLKVLLGELELNAGSVKRGEFRLGYFSQELGLDGSKNLIETFCPNGGDRINVNGKNLHVYGYLKSWLFPKEFLEQKIGVLSGGEQTRVKLALLFSKQYDCLILDEPTNNLDIATINILEEYLINYKACVIFVSHDKYFTDKAAAKLFSFQDAKINVLSCSYSEVLEALQDAQKLEGFAKEAAKEQGRAALAADTDPSSKGQDLAQGRGAKTAKKLSYKETRRQQELPALIEALETETAKLAKCLENPSACADAGGIAEIYKTYEDKKSLLDRLVDEYLELEERAGGGCG
ncbi:MAG: ABC-F family ATP-binding cassette domain-containing protein [Helicobacteraceae bacterium]